jgi:hypothetical protein
MIRHFKDLILDVKIKFPLPKNDYGFYTPIYTEQEHNLRCPHCGGSAWSVKNYQHLECNMCYRNYCNLGVLGLEELKDL